MLRRRRPATGSSPRGCTGATRGSPARPPRRPRGCRCRRPRPRCRCRTGTCRGTCRWSRPPSGRPRTRRPRSRRASTARRRRRGRSPAGSRRPPWRLAGDPLAEAGDPVAQLARGRVGVGEQVLVGVELEVLRAAAELAVAELELLGLDRPLELLGRVRDQPDLRLGRLGAGGNSEPERERARDRGKL